MENMDKVFKNSMVDQNDKKHVWEEYDSSTACNQNRQANTKKVHQKRYSIKGLEPK